MHLSYTSLKDNDLFILTDFTCDPSQQLLDRDDLFKVVWCKAESSTLLIDGYDLTLNKDDMIFCTPLNVVRVKGGNEGIVSVVFNKEFFCIQTHDDQVSCHGFLFFGSSEPQRVKLEGKEKENFEQLFQMLEEDLAIKDYLQGEMLRSLLKRILIKATRMVKVSLPEPTINTSQLNVIRQYNVLVEKHFREYHTVQDYAKLLFKSPKTLSNIFPKFSDKSPLMVINERILLEARRLLIYSDLTTNDISMDLGYKDPSHFSKFFKKHIGLTPTNFRKNKFNPASSY